MYYAHMILNKKGPLAKIWLAAHWDKKLTKAQIYETNIESTIETILEPQMKLALRTSGHLLLGVCRIYSRKVKYLLADCNEAFVKIKLAFRPGLIDLPKEKQQAQVEAITLPEKFPEFSMLADINMMEDMDFGETTTLNAAASSTMHLNLNQQQARIEDITLKEDFGGGTFVAPQDDDFGDMGSFGIGGMDMDTFMMSDMERGRRVENSLGVNEQDVDFYDDNSAFGANQIDNDSNAAKNNDLNADLNTDHRMDTTTNAAIPNKIGDFSSHLENPENNLDDETMMQTNNDDIGGGGDDNNDMMGLTTAAPNVVPTLFDDQPTMLNNNNNNDATKKSDEAIKKNEEDVGSEVSDLPKDTNVPPAATTTTTTAVEKQIRAKRRRKLIIDDVKEIDSATMKAQLSDTTGILGSLELAPPTRQLMYMKENGVVEKLFSMTSRPLSSKLLQKLYTRNMTTKSLIDITNNTKPPTKSTTTTVTNIVINNSNININDLSTARDNNDPSINNQTKGELPLADSYLEDQSKRVTINETDINMDQQQNGNPNVNELDEFDQFGGPASIFNQGDNLDLLLDDYPNQINLEVTPSKLNVTDKAKKIDDTTAVASDDSDDDEDETNKKANKTTSPHRKRSYKRTTLNQSNKENKEDGDDDADETLTATDPTKNLNKRAKTLVTLLNNKFAKTENVGFFDIIKRNGKKSVVQKFYSLLVLKKYDIIEVYQEETYGDIILTKGEKFENFVS